jgi:octaprenyl-diphosphate synthase
MALEKINALIQQDLQNTEAAMHGAMHSQIPLIATITQHISDGGKRMRPVIVLLIAHALGFQGQEKINLAVIIEFIHTATLLHDDVVDSSEMRRGKPSANSLWGNESSVLVGDFLYSRAFQKLVAINSASLLDILSSASNVMAEGEVLQLMNRHNHEITTETYFQIIEAKTAKLFEAAASMSASLAGADSTLTQQIGSYGKHLGLAFQLVDDALDYSSDASTLGKNIGDDLAEGKATLPLIYALHHSEGDIKTAIETAIATGGEEHLATIQLAIKKTNAIEHTLSLAKEHIEKAKQALDELAKSDYKQALKKLADFVIDRDF